MDNPARTRRRVSFKVIMGVRSFLGRERLFIAAPLSGPRRRRCVENTAEIRLAGAVADRQQKKLPTIFFRLASFIKIPEWIPDNSPSLRYVEFPA
jgi:hypothetical protein